MKPAGFTLVCGLALSAWAPLGAQSVGGCPMFPANNIWNTPIDTAPASPRSAAYINSIGPSTGLHADFGSGLWDGGPIGIPYAVVNGAQPKKAVAFEYADESDPGPYPIPDNPPIEGGPESEGDRHILIVDSTNCVLYELYSAYPQPNGSWRAGSGAVFGLTDNQLRPQGWTSADAAGLPILPGLVRYEEALSGEIRHAIRFTAQTTQRAYVWPARHYASSNTSQNVPPMGQRFRLRAGFDVSGFPPLVRTILNAMKKYGIILADNGSNWFISGAPDERWDNDELRTLRNVKGSDFEAVDVSSLMVNADSAEAIAPDGMALSAVTLEQAGVTGGQTTTGNRVALTGAAPNGGAVAALSSSNPGVASVPPSVTIAEGDASAAFSIQTQPVSSPADVAISASYAGVTVSTTLRVLPPALLSVWVPGYAWSGRASAGRVSLTGPAAAPCVVSLTSSNPAALPVPATVTVPAGAISAAFFLRAGEVATNTTVNVTATYNGATSSDVIIVRR